MKYSGKLLYAVKASHGFTLIELLVVVAIVGVMVALAVPAYDDFFDRKRLVAAAEIISSRLQQARSEAIQRSQDVYVKFDTDSSYDWAFGMSESSGCDPWHGLSDSDPCYLRVSDDAGDWDSSNRLLWTTDSSAYPDVKLIDATFTADQGKFDYVRGTAKAGSIKLESKKGFRLKVVTSLTGRIRVCSPSGAVHVSGYPDNSCSW